MKKVLTSLFAVILLVAVSPLAKVDASSKLDKQDAFRLLNKSFELQVSLSEQPRAMEDIQDLLSESFSDEYTKDFIDMNVQKSMDGKGFQTYGTDMALYYIPFFTYSENTEIGYSSLNDHWYVYEWFPENTDGPVSYDGHYEAIGLVYKDNKWVINDYQIAFDPEVIDNGEDETQTSKEVEPSTLTLVDKMTDFISYGFINQMSHWVGMYSLK